jgi:hypothetical protein
VESLPSKRRILKKREKRKIEKGREKKKREQGLKSKRGETSYEEAPRFKRRKEKREDKIYKLLGEILSKERKKGNHIFIWCKI